MKVVDKEQERIDYENSPAGKRKQWLGLLAALVFFLITAVLYRLFPNVEIGGGKPYVIVMNGVEVTPGKTTVQDLADAGYDLTDTDSKIMMNERDENGDIVYRYRDVYDLTSEVESRTLYSSLVLVKGEEQAASISIVNNGASNIPLSQCIVSDIAIYSDYVDADKVTVGGTPFAQLSVEKITELFGKQERKFNDATTIWEKGNYSLYLEIKDDGTVRRVSSNKYYKTDILDNYYNN